MKDSSKRNNSCFKGIRYVQITHFLKTIKSLSSPDISNVKRRYEEHQINFTQTLTFLQDLGIVSLKGEHLILPTPFSAYSGKAQDNRQQIAYLLSQKIMQGPKKYREEVSSFLKTFYLISGHAVSDIRPSLTQRHSFARNFLIEVGLVRTDLLQKRYILNDSALDLFVNESFSSHRSLKHLKNDLLCKSELGYKAEMVILKYELDRVEPSLRNRVKYLAEDDTSLGYDIISCDFNSNNDIIPRFIEVKAVSQISYEFYWTRNEMNVAKQLQQYYYLYLLPIVNRDKFNLNSLLIIPNPYDHICKQRNKWTVEENVVVCRRLDE